MIRLFSIALAISLLISPDSQVILGNAMGLAGPLLYPILILVVLLAMVLIKAYGEIQPVGEFNFLLDSFGTWPALTTFMASRIVFFITTATMILATAGFIFNEVFIYWFPNFGFAFLVLGFVIAINLFGPKVSNYAQLIFCGTWLIGLLILVGFGVTAPTHPKAIGQAAFSAQGIFLPFLLLIGVEFGLIGLRTQTKPNNTILKSALAPKLQFLIVPISLIFLGLGLWAMVMAKMLSPELLQSTFIPHTKTASRLLVHRLINFSPACRNS